MLAPDLPEVGRRTSRVARCRAAVGRFSPLTVAPLPPVDSPTFWGWPPWLSPVHTVEGQRSGARTLEVHA